MSTQKHNIVYGLIDPFSKELRYIGKSVSGLKRARAHFRDKYLQNDRTWCGNWIKSLKNRGVLPEIEILQALYYQVSSSHISHILAGRRTNKFGLIEVPNGSP